MGNTERELELIRTVKELISALRELVDYHVPENHPDFTLATDTMRQAEKLLEK